MVSPKKKYVHYFKSSSNEELRESGRILFFLPRRNKPFSLSLFPMTRLLNVVSECKPTHFRRHVIQLGFWGSTIYPYAWQEEGFCAPIDHYASSSTDSSSSKACRNNIPFSRCRRRCRCLDAADNNKVEEEQD
jgi:hypothetical protein